MNRLSLKFLLMNSVLILGASPIGYANEEDEKVVSAVDDRCNGRPDFDPLNKESVSREIGCRKLELARLEELEKDISSHSEDQEASLTEKISNDLNRSTGEDEDRVAEGFWRWWCNNISSKNRHCLGHGRLDKW